MKCMQELEYQNAVRIPSQKKEPVAIPGCARFSMADYVTPGTQIGNYRVTYVGKSFLKHFGNIVEENIPDCVLDVTQIGQKCMDPDVILSLGGPEAFAENLMYHLVEIIRRGVDGPGAFNGYTNLFYKTSPVDGKLWSPHFYLRGDRLGFGALPACYDDGWEPGDLIYQIRQK